MVKFDWDKLESHFNNIGLKYKWMYNCKGFTDRDIIFIDKSWDNEKKFWFTEIRDYIIE